MAEEYLQDHFATFPVLPGVMMVESLVQAARLVLDRRTADAGAAPCRWVLGKVRALKYGTFVRPGSSLRVEVSHAKQAEDGSHEFKAQALLLDPSAPAGTPPPVAVSGRISLRPLKLPAAVPTSG